MKQGFLAAALMAGALVIGGTAAALDVPEKYGVIVEFTPEGEAAPFKSMVRCRRSDTCHQIVKVPIDGKERSVLFSSRVRGADVIELEFIPWSADRWVFDGVSVRHTYERNFVVERQVRKAGSVETGTKDRFGMKEFKRIERAKGRVRFTVSAD